MKISLCLIVWNELQGCKTDVPHLPRTHFDEIFAIDGGSTDGTVEYLESQGIAVHRQRKRELNGAYVHANAIANGDAVVVFFPKGTLRISDLLQFRPLLEKGSELVIASRQLSGSVNEDDTQFWRPRKWAVLGLAATASLIWRREGAWVRDILHGVKGWRRSAFDRMKVLDTGLSIDLEMVVRAYKLRIPRMEFPTMEVSRAYGGTHFKFWPTGKKLLRYIWFELRRLD